MCVSKNRGTPKSSILIILIGCSIINHPFWATPIFGNTHILIYIHLQTSIGTKKNIGLKHRHEKMRGTHRSSTVPPFTTHPTLVLPNAPWDQQIFTLPETNQRVRPLKRGRNPKGKDRLPTPVFQVRPQSFTTPP